MAFDMPARQSFVVELVGRKDVPSAVGLNSSLFNAARAIGPGVAGLLLQHFSLATCFLLNAASYLMVIGGIALMRGKTLGDPVKLPADESRPSLWENLRGGLSFVKHNHTIINVIMLVGVLGMFGLAYNVLVPTFVRYDLLPDATSSQQVKVFGFLESVRGIGALAAALLIVVMNKPERLKWNIIVGALLSNTVVLIYALERNINVAYLTMAVSTFGFVLIFASANTVMQLSVPDHLRGRVMAIYTLVFIGSGPIGSLMAGHLAEHIGAPHTIFLFALLTIVAVVVIAFRPGGLYTITVASGDRPISHLDDQSGKNGIIRNEDENLSTLSKTAATSVSRN
jgi:MFS family permease